MKMTWKTVICLVLIALVAGVSEGQRRRGGGGGGGGGSNLPPAMRGEGSQAGRRDRAEAMRAFPVAQMWAEASLGMELDDEKVAQLKPIFVEAYKLKQGLLKEAREEDTWAYAKAQLQKADRELWPKVSKVLSRRERRNLERTVRQR